MTDHKMAHVMKSYSHNDHGMRGIVDSLFRCNPCRLSSHCMLQYTFNASLLKYHCVLASHDDLVASLRLNPSPFALHLLVDLLCTIV
jgi:hypothetical protein